MLKVACEQVDVGTSKNLQKTIEQHQRCWKLKAKSRI